MIVKLEPIGIVHSTRSKPEDDYWDKEKSHIEISDRFSEETLIGLDEFSHIEVVFFFHKIDLNKVITTTRHPRNRTDWPKVGLFAQRNKNRPSQIGLTTCRILKIEEKRIYVSGLDAIDGTPVLDIKPWVKEFGPRGDQKQPAWTTELMKQYWK